MAFKDLKSRTLTSFFLIIFFLIFIFSFDNAIDKIFYLIYLIILIEICIFFRLSYYILITSILYLFFSFIFLIIYFENFYSKNLFIFTISLVIVFDISSYILGTKFGRVKILPKISPNKTVFGFLSGLIITFLFGLIINYYYFFLNALTIILFNLMIILSAFLGDIIQSYLKRKSLLKNSSNFLPGHGGFFDRFDSLLMVFIFLVFLNIILI